MSFCKYCGKEISEGTKFCTKCGNPVGSAPAPGASPERQDPEFENHAPERQEPDFGRSSQDLPRTETPPSKRSRLSTGEKIILCISLIVICAAAVITILLFLNNGDLPGLSKSNTAKNRAASEQETLADSEKDEEIEISSDSDEKTASEIFGDSDENASTKPTSDSDDGAAPETSDKPENTVDETLNDDSSSAPSFRNVDVGDVITFGSYEQDNDFSNGEEEIEWLVLAKEHGKLLLISKYALDRMPYHYIEEEVTWETCSLREWLNNEFLNAAFSFEEQERILSEKVRADENPDYDVDPGKDTTDKIFLLSVAETEKYFETDEDRLCLATEYAHAQGVYVLDDNYSDGSYICFWWLRTPGYARTSASVLTSIGVAGTSGNGVTGTLFAVRPAMWIEL